MNKRLSHPRGRSNGTQELVGHHLVDPDPITIGIGLYGAIVSTKSWLEARRKRLQAEKDEQAKRKAERDKFLGSYLAAREALKGFHGRLEEFERIVNERKLGNRQFRYGSATLDVSQRENAELLSLYRRVLANGSELADTSDRLSAYLDATYQPAITRLDALLREAGFPNTFADAVALCRKASHEYEKLLDDVSNHEKFPK
jgi:hypothetical protein